jgi:pilus assembly protein FimV
MAAREQQRSSHFDESAEDSELEQYGVWVKVGPEDVSEAEAGDEDFAFADLSEDELGSVEMDDEEFRLDDGMEVSLDIGDMSEDAAQADSPEEESEELLSLDDDELDISFDDGTEELGVDQLTEIDDSEPVEAEPVEGEEETLSLDEIQDTEDSLEDALLDETEDLTSVDDELESLDLGSLEDEDDTASSIVSDDDLPNSLDDIKLDLTSLDVDDYQEAEGAPESISEEPDILNLESDEVQIEELGEFDELDELGDLDDIGDVSQLGEPESIELEEEELDLDDLAGDLEEISPEPVEASLTEETDEQEDGTEVVELDLSSLPLEDDDFDDLTLDTVEEIESDLPELESEDGVSLSLEEGFDDVAAVEDQMFGGPATGDTGNDRLANIEAEITALREQMREISAMHQELQAIQSHLTARDDSVRSAPETAPEADEDEDGLGFFEEEEDETIALTTDELDNIMDTAEFTEQSGEPTDAEAFGIVASVEESESFEPEEDTNDFLDLDGGPIQEITLDEAPDDIGTLEIDLDDTGSESVSESLEDPFEDSGIDTLSSIDIDSELADVEELQDSSEAEDIRTPVHSSTAGESLETEEDDEVLEALPQDDEPPANPFSSADSFVPENLKEDLRLVLSYMDTLLDSLPEDKIQEFADSEHFQTYKNLFVELGLEE